MQAQEALINKPPVLGGQDMQQIQAGIGVIGQPGGAVSMLPIGAAMHGSGHQHMILE